MKTASVTKLLEVGQIVSKYLDRPHFEWQTIAIFLLIAQETGDVSMQVVEKRTGLAQAAVSRNVAKLSRGLTHLDTGAQLLDVFENPMNRREKLCRITARGRALLADLEKALA